MSWLRAICIASCVTASAMGGQVVRDGTVGPSGAVLGPDFVISDSDGQTRGGNVFHSFNQFNLSEGESATFTGPSSIRNVLVRVTGGSVSSIDGAVNCDIAGANLIFINPFGVLFGPHATMNVSGSLAVTTADYVKLSDGGRFDARMPANDILTAAPPSAFGFLGPTVAPIALTGVENPDNPPLFAFLPDGKSVWLVGGDLRYEGFLIGAPSGRFVMVSVASTGELSVDLENPGAAVDTAPFPTLGTLRLTGGATPYVSGAPSGSLTMEADRIFCESAGILGDNFGDTNGGDTEIRARASLMMSQSSIGAIAIGAGSGSGVLLEAPSISLADTSISTDTVGAGRAGSIRIVGDDLAMVGGGQVSVNSGQAGPGGDLEIDADRITIRGVSGTSPRLAALSFGAPSGRIIVRADIIELLTGGQIRSDSVGTGSPGGDIEVTAQTLYIDDQQVFELTGISSRSIEAGSGGGNIMLNVEHIELHNGAEITATSDNAGPSGSVTINGDEVVVDSESTIASAASAGGSAGGVTLCLDDSLNLLSGGMLSVSAASSDGGDISVEVGREIRLVEGEITARADGDGGNIRLVAPSLIYLRDSIVSAESVGGDGGNIAIDPVFVVVDHSQIVANAVVGNGGDIHIVSEFFLETASLVDASSQFGLQGRVTITEPDADLSGNLVELPVSLLPAEVQLGPHCSERVPAGLSSFVVTGGKGRADEPGRFLFSVPSVAGAP